MDSHEVCILDTNICLDLYWGGIVEAAFALPFDFLLPDLIREELLKPKELALAFGRVETLSLTGSQVSRVYELKQDRQLTRLTINDLAAFVLAQDTEAILLTNDKDLRELAERHRVKSHGILWLLDILVSTAGLAPRTAADALDRIIACGSWLPRDQCQKRLIEWRRTI